MFAEGNNLSSEGFKGKMFVLSALLNGLESSLSALEAVSGKLLLQCCLVFLIQCCAAYDCAPEAPSKVSEADEAADKKKEGFASRPQDTKKTRR